jgi:hypothetical protein
MSNPTVPSALTATAAEGAPKAAIALNAAQQQPAGNPPPREWSRLAKLDWLLLPAIGIVVVVALWFLLSATLSKDLPNPTRTLEAS